MFITTSPKNSIKSFIIDCIRNYILTEDNLVEMVKLTNRELAQAGSEYKEKLELIDRKISEIGIRLGRLYYALETGKFESSELSPRIRELMRKQEELRQLRIEAQQTLYYESKHSVDYQVILDYADKLRNLLASSSITEQRSLLQSFCNKIEVNNTGIKMYYTVPVPPYGDSEELVGFVPIVHHG